MLAHLMLLNQVCTLFTEIVVQNVCACVCMYVCVCVYLRIHLQYVCLSIHTYMSENLKELK